MSENKERSVDHSTKEEFYDYYKEESLKKSTIDRLKRIRDTVLKKASKKQNQIFNIADIGCGAGTLSMLLANKGHHVHAIDVNEPLVELAKERAKEEGLDIDYQIGTATKLPWDSESIDICIVPELLEHVKEWRECLDEFSRILKPGGILYLSTNNTLCPKQQEFDLPLYSWYPNPIKRYCEKLAITTHPQIAGHATYPAVNWFTFYSLKKEFDNRNMSSVDRFDLSDDKKSSALKKLLITLIKNVPIARLIGHIFTPYTLIVGEKR